MKIAVLNFLGSTDKIYKSDFMKSLPKFILDLYIKLFNPYIKEETTILGAEAYKITLPFSKKEYKEKPYTHKLLEKTILLLTKNEDIIFTAPKEINLSENIQKVSENYITAVSIFELIKIIIKRRNLNLEKCHFIILDGKNSITNTVINKIYPEVNYFSIFTEEPENFEKSAEYIFEDTGLNINIFSNTKNSELRQCDIIINCGNTNPEFDYRFKKNAVYIDLSLNAENIKRLISKRNDLFITDSIMFKKDNTNYTAEIIETVLCCLCDGFYIEYFETSLKKLDLKVKSPMLFGKEINL